MSSNLPSAADPLILADGTKINPTNGEVIRDITEEQGIEAVPSDSEARRELVNIRRTVRDLPEVPSKMHLVSAVLSYELFGLMPQDIASILQLTVPQVRAVQSSEAYGSFRDDVIKRFSDSEAEDVRRLIEQKTKIAVDKIVRTMDSGNETLAFKASQDILDRGGHRAADIVEHRHKISGGLRVTYIDSDRDSIPVKNIIEGAVEGAVEGEDS